jgi:hypothetical protein
MFNRQFGFLVMATLLLSPNLVHASAFDENTHLSVGNVQINTTDSGTTLRTPKIQIDTPKTTESRILISGRRRIRTPAIRRGRTPSVMRRQIESNVQTTINKTSTTNNPSGRRIIPAAATTRQQIESNVQTTINKTLPMRNSTIQNSTVRSSTIQNSTTGSRSVNQQHQSVNCSGGGSSVSQSISTVNGRTVSSEVRGNCNNSNSNDRNDD